MSGHVVLDTTAQPPVMRCLHCSETAVLRLPLPISVVVRKTEAYTRLHEDCPPSEGAPAHAAPAQGAEK